MRRCSRLLNGLQHPKLGLGAGGGGTEDDEGSQADGSAAVGEACLQLRALVELHRSKYISTFHKYFSCVVCKIHKYVCVWFVRYISTFVCGL